MSLAACLLVLAPLACLDSGDEELRARWRTALELDQAALVVREARAAFEERAALKKDGELIALSSRALARCGAVAAARAQLTGAEVSPATRAAVDLGLARMDLEADRLGAVLAALAGEAASSPRFSDQPESWLLYGKALARRGEGEKAQTFLQHFVRTWPLHIEAPSAWHILARAALTRRDLDLARLCRDRGQELSTWHGFHKTRRLQIRADPDAPLPRLGLAQLWISAKQHERAREVLAELCRRCEEFADGFALLGEVERKLERTQAALRAFDRALELDPKLHDVRFNRGVLALFQGQSSLARGDFEALVQGDTAEDPRYLTAHLYLARLLEGNKEKEAAARRFERYRELGGNEEL
ncbi:MAG: tetratricopeptide repeat protein [bacterium]|nr:hypothetical protein [Planctomycetota bacterium]HIL52088.1 hypothetical protein [Planctomycetota bacterium]